MRARQDRDAGAPVVFDRGRIKKGYYKLCVGKQHTLVSVFL